MTAKQLENAVERYYDDILRYYVYRLRNRSCAEDLTQETFYRFIRYAAGEISFSHEKKCRAYLYQIASNVYRDYFTNREDTEELHDYIPASADDKEISIVLESALAKLPDPQREAAVLYYYSGFHVREIAEIQGATISAVKSRLKLARDTLKTILSREEDLY